MALGDPYATTAQLTARLARAEAYAGEFDALLDAASKHVERFCQRQFNTDGSVSDREFEPDDGEFLAVDDFHTVVGLVIDVDGDTVDLADVTLEPRNGIVDGQPGWPFFQIIARSTAWPIWSWYRNWPLDAPVVTVSANWGWAAVPAGIVQATLDVAEAMGGAGHGTGALRSETIEDVTETYYQFPALGMAKGDVPPALEKAAHYRRKRWGVA